MKSLTAGPTAFESPLRRAERERRDLGPGPLEDSRWWEQARYQHLPTPPGYCPYCGRTGTSAFCWGTDQDPHPGTARVFPTGETP